MNDVGSVVSRSGFAQVRIIVAGLGAMSGIILVNYYPAWAVIYVAIAVTVFYGLAGHFDQAASA
jgi:hypothetical protein